MKKIIAVCMLCAACIGVLAGCAQEELEYSIGSYDEESRISVSKVHEETDSQSEDSFDHSGSNETFLIKHKIYSYEENNVAIVDVTNETDTDYRFTITGTYLDETDGVLKTETQTFMFPAKYQKYFLFQPKIPFSKFTYTVDMIETAETCYAKYLSLKFKGVFETLSTSNKPGDDFTFYPTIAANTSSSYECRDNVRVGFPLTWIIFDENDELLSMFGNVEFYREYYYNPSFEGNSTYEIYQSENDTMDPEMSKRFGGKIRAIVIVGDPIAE